MSDDSSFFYQSASLMNLETGESKKWLRGKAGDTWENTRYVIELSLGLHAKARGKSRAQGGHLLGHEKDMWCRWKREHPDKPVPTLSDSEIVRPGSYIVVVCWPTPIGLRPYVPYAFRERDASLAPANAEDASNEAKGKLQQMIDDPNITEEEKLKAIIETSVEIVPPPKSRLRMGGFGKEDVHASVYTSTSTSTNSVIKAPSSYRCSGCGETGTHFRQHCPQKDGLALDKIRIAFGIPKALLRPVQSGDDMKEAMMAADGTGYVVLLSASPTNGNGGPSELKPSDFVSGLKPTWEWIEGDDEATQLDPLDCEAYLACEDAKEMRAADEFYVKNPRMRRKAPTVCQHWLAGICFKGALMCEHQHTMDNGLVMPVCKFFAENVCANGAECKFRHEMETFGDTRKECDLYRQGFCPDGPKCFQKHVKRWIPTASLTGLTDDEFAVMARILGIELESKVQNASRRPSEMVEDANSRKRSHPIADPLELRKLVPEHLSEAKMAHRKRMMVRRGDFRDTRTF